MEKKIIFKTISSNFLSNFKQFYNPDFPFLYIHEHILKNLWEQFKWWLRFSFLIYSWNFLEKFSYINISSDKITDKIFFFSMYKGIKIFLKKKTKNDKNMPKTDTRIFWKKKEEKRQYNREHNKNASEEEKES